MKDGQKTFKNKFEINCSKFNGIVQPKNNKRRIKKQKVLIFYKKQKFI